MKSTHCLGLLLLFAIFRPASGVASAAPLTICTQNLNNFPPENPKKAEKQKLALVQRFQEANCDIIALQEVQGGSEKDAEKNLRILTRLLNRRSDKQFDPIVRETNDKRIRNGFLLDSKRLRVQFVKSFSRQPVQSLQPLGPVRHFSRGPLMLLVYDKQTAGSPGLLITTDHLKSKADGWKDITKTNYEFLRMETAEAARKIVLAEKSLLPANTPLLLLGDFNSNSDSATAAILSGRMELSDFMPPVSCSLTPELQPSCPKPVSREPTLIPILASAAKSDPALRGTYRYRNQLDTIDDVFINREALSLVQNPDGKLCVGIVGTFGVGSDHKLVWVRVDSLGRLPRPSKSR